MKEVRVLIPDEYYYILNFNQDDMPGIAVVNTALRDFEGKEVFSWHLSLVLNFKDLIENGMPSKKERKVVEKFEDKLNKLIKGKDKKKPNALFLARITWKSTRELIWRVVDPVETDKVFRKIPIIACSTPSGLIYHRCMYPPIVLEVIHILSLRDNTKDHTHKNIKPCLIL
jgi:hypothetical protein